jgi:hypothetical protein
MTGRNTSFKGNIIQMEGVPHENRLRVLQKEASVIKAKSQP